jgi:DNA-binding SARP family transcriptional activator
METDGYRAVAVAVTKAQDLSPPCEKCVTNRFVRKKRTGLFPAMAQFELRLLGGIEATLDGQSVTFPTRHCAFLLAYLVLANGKAVPRDRLASLLWADRAEREARGSLRQTLYRLRTMLAPMEPSPIVSDQRTASFDLQNSWCDAVQLEAAVTCDAASLAEAFALYKGDLCQGAAAAGPEFEAWLAEEQARLRGLALQGFHRLGAAQAETRQFADMAVTARKLIEMDPFDERFCRLMMTACLRRDQRKAALVTYKELETRLQNDLGIAPEAETTALFDAIRDGGSATPQPRPTEVPQPTPDTEDAPLEQEIRFCISRDNIRIAYGTSGAGPAIVETAT